MGRRTRAGKTPAWVRLNVAAFGALLLLLVAYLRAVSGLGHFHAVQGVSDLSPSVAAAACEEGLAAVDDFWPVVPLLGIGRLLPVGSARAWGQVPLVADVAREACPAVQLYATIAPWPDTSLADGVAADLLADVRRQRVRIVASNGQLTRAWQSLGGVDTAAMSADTRLARVGRLIVAARAQSADVADVLALTTPEHIEALLGGQGSRSIVFEVVHADTSTRAYAVLDDGRVREVMTGDPAAPPSLSIGVNDAALADVLAKLKNLRLAPGMDATEVPRAILNELVHRPLADVHEVGEVLKKDADQHQAWFASTDPALQSLIARHGWVRP